MKYLFDINRFNAYTAVFCLFVVFTGGSYAALALVSSNIFGLKILSSGLTQFELKQLSNIKVFGTIVLENVPQLMLQLLYASERGVTQSVGIAFFASILSVIATLLSYLIDRNGNEVKPVQYYLTIQCQRNGNGDASDPRDRNDDNAYDGTDGAMAVKAHVSHRDITMGNKVTSVEETSSNPNQLSPKESLNIMNNKGRTELLGMSLAALYQIQPKNIEIGSTLCHKTGATIHVVHMVYQTELEIMEQELGQENGITINPYFYTQQLFISLEKEITELLLNHFKLNHNEFVVLYDDFTGLNKRKMTRGLTVDNQYHASNRNLLKKVATSAKLNMNNNDRVASVLNDYMNDGVGDKRMKQRHLYQMIDNMMNDERRIKETMEEESEDLSFSQHEMGPNDENIAVEMVSTNGNTMDNAKDGELVLVDDDNDESRSHRL